MKLKKKTTTITIDEAYLDIIQKLGFTMNNFYNIAVREKILRSIDEHNKILNFVETDDDEFQTRIKQCKIDPTNY